MQYRSPVTIHLPVGAHSRAILGGMGQNPAGDNCAAPVALAAVVAADLDRIGAGLTLRVCGAQDLVR